MKGRKEIYTSEPEPKFPNAANSGRNQTPHRGLLPVLPSICVVKNVPKSTKCVIIVAIENAKFKLLKVLPCYNNTLCDSSYFFYNNKPGRHGAVGYSPQSVT